MVISCRYGAHGHILKWFYREAGWRCPWFGTVSPGRQEYKNFAIRKVDLKKLDFGKKAIRRITVMAAVQSEDVTAQATQAYSGRWRGGDVSAMTGSSGTNGQQNLHRIRTRRAGFRCLRGNSGRNPACSLCLAQEVLRPHRWVLPGVTFKAATSPEEYQARLRQAEAKLTTPTDWLLTWGYHPLWHGKLDRASLDAISATRPIAVWHRSCHEFYLNTPALAALGITEAMTQGKGQASEQSNWAEGHFWEGGLNLMMGPMLKVLATPERLTFGLEADGGLPAPQRRDRL